MNFGAGKSKRFFKFVNYIWVTISSPCSQDSCNCSLPHRIRYSITDFPGHCQDFLDFHRFLQPLRELYCWVSEILAFKLDDWDYTPDNGTELSFLHHAQIISGTHTFPSDRQQPFCPWIKQRGREVDYSPLPGTETKNASPPLPVRLHEMAVKRKENAGTAP
jgi:hypothetical protein